MGVQELVGPGQASGGYADARVVVIGSGSFRFGASRCVYICVYMAWCGVYCVLCASCVCMCCISCMYLLYELYDVYIICVICVYMCIRVREYL